MQKTLLRQLKRSIGIAGEAELAELLASLKLASTSAGPALRGMLEGFPELLTRVDGLRSEWRRAETALKSLLVESGA